MKRAEIMNTIRQLACSQGFYSRLYSRLADAEANNFDAYDAFMGELEAQNFGDAVDLVLYLEC